MKNDFLTIPDAPNYEINSELVVRNKRTGKTLKPLHFYTLWNNGKQIGRTAKSFRQQAQSLFKDDFLTIPDAPDYEINSDLVVRKKSNGRILKASLRIGKTFKTITVYNNGKEIRRNIKTFRQQAVTAFKDSQLKHEYDDWWQPIPSLNDLYEINPNGVLRNVRTKHVLALHNSNNFRGYTITRNHKSVSRSVKSLLWEAHGIIHKPPHNTPIATTISKGKERLYFPTLADLSRFFVRSLNKNFHTVYRHLRDRPDNIYGWNITYHKPDDIGDVKMTVCKALKGAH